MAALDITSIRHFNCAKDLQKKMTQDELQCNVYKISRPHHVQRLTVKSFTYVALQYLIVPQHIYLTPNS